MTSNSIILDLKSVFRSHSFTETRLPDEFLFAHEVSEVNDLGKIIRKYTKITNIQPNNRHFKVKNTEIGTETVHICIDGDFIPYGKAKYNNLRPDVYSEGRPDSLIFNNKTLVFLELKVDQEETTESKEDPKWKKFSEGANQILDFVNFLKDNGLEIKSYYSNVFAVVCFRFEPNFSLLRGNSQRNGQRVKLREKLGFDLIAHNYKEIFEI